MAAKEKYTRAEFWENKVVEREHAFRRRAYPASKYLILLPSYSSYLWEEAAGISQLLCITKTSYFPVAVGVNR